MLAMLLLERGGEGSSLLFPSFSVRSSGGLRGSLLFGGGGIFLLGGEPVNQRSDGDLELVLTVARHLGAGVYGICE